jgi:hypothetical protein
VKNNEETADGAAAAGVPKKGPGQPRKAIVVGPAENEESAPLVPDKARKKPTQIVAAAAAAEDSVSEVPPPEITKTQLKKAAAAGLLCEVRCHHARVETSTLASRRGLRRKLGTPKHKWLWIVRRREKELRRWPGRRRQPSDNLWS